MQKSISIIVGRYHDRRRVFMQTTNQSLSLQSDITTRGVCSCRQPINHYYCRAISPQEACVHVDNQSINHYHCRAISPQEANHLFLHYSAFLSTIQKQGTKEQVEKYVSLGQQLKIIGTYAQTELGHGKWQMRQRPQSDGLLYIVSGLGYSDPSQTDK